MSEYAKYMDEAWRLYENAALDLNLWRERKGEEDELRVIAKMAWEAVSLVAWVVMESRGVQPPPAWRARRNAFYFMEKERPDVRARKMGIQLGSIGGELLRECFYDGECRPKNIIRSITIDAREFLERAEALLNGTHPAASEEARDARVYG